jgi:hypothetical protein
MEVHKQRNPKNSLKAKNIIRAFRVSAELNKKVHEHLKQHRITEAELYRQAVERYLQQV